MSDTVGAPSTGRPSGTVSFLFTDIEGSTRRWEADPVGMGSALAQHDDVLAAAVAAHGGWLFKHTGDGVCAAFGSARAALDAAVQAQRELALPVRMAVATGEVERRGDDYFGPTLNRAARIMAAGHGGQILTGSSTASLVPDADLVDLGEHRLRDLSRPERLYQARAAGLASDFPPLRTIDVVPGNLPVQVTSLVGREAAVKELAELVRAQRLVTLTGVGGVGKTRLALQVAGELATEFPEGAWLVELAGVGTVAAVPDAVANALHLTPQTGAPVVQAIANALAGQRALVVLDNCEHVIDAVAGLAEAILARTVTVHLIATSREALRLDAERRWPVPTLDVTDGVASPAVELFVTRARSVNPAFAIGDGTSARAVAELCSRLDGIALAIELAAARMASMTPTEVLARLRDRFRLLSGPPRAGGRHQTLLHAVRWSYDLLGDDERLVLNRVSAFSDGFDLTAAAHLCAPLDEYQVLDVLDSLVRKSLIFAEVGPGPTRYGMLETIRQYAQGELSAAGLTSEVGDRHARYFATQTIGQWLVWNGPGQRDALAWVEAEFANLRAAFRWAADRDDLVTAAAIAAHASMIAWPLQRFEPVGWAEEILPRAAAAGIAQLPRLHAAAALCMFTGRPDDSVRHAELALASAAADGADPFDEAWSRLFEGGGHLYAGRVDTWLEHCARLAERPGFGHVAGRCGMVHALVSLQRDDEARAIAEETVVAARAAGNPYWVAWALFAAGRAHAATEPERALRTFREGLAYARDHRLTYWEARIARDAAGLEAVHGLPSRALEMLDTAIHLLHRAGDDATLATAFAYLAILFHQLGRSEIAARIAGAASAYTSTHSVIRFSDVIEELGAVHGNAELDRLTALGAALGAAEATSYARRQIEAARGELAREAGAAGPLPDGTLTD